MSIKQILSPEIQKIIQEHCTEDIRSLALKLGKSKHFPVNEIIEQVSGRQKAEKKLPQWFNTLGIIFPPGISMEQCSSEKTARYKSGLVSGEKLIDLTSGFGVDATFFSKTFKEVEIIEPQEKLLETVQHNLKQFGIKNVKLHCTTAVNFLEKLNEKADCIYLDPSRRNENKQKTFLLKDGEPNVLEMLPSLLEKADKILIKTAPMLDIDMAVTQLKFVEKVIVIAVNNECKEVLYFLKRDFKQETSFEAVNLLNNDSEQRFKFYRSQERALIPEFSLPLNYLYEPNAAILKAGAFKSIAVKSQIYKLHTNSHLYTSDKLINNFPGRVFKIKAICKYDKKEILKHLPDLKANIAVRNFKDPVNAIIKKTGINEGGDFYVFATTDLTGKPIILITKKQSLRI